MLCIHTFYIPDHHAQLIGLRTEYSHGVLHNPVEQTMRSRHFTAIPYCRNCPINRTALCPQPFEAQIRVQSVPQRNTFDDCEYYLVNAV
jgi:hypothetical protein